MMRILLLLLLLAQSCISEKEQTYPEFDGDIEAVMIDLFVADMAINKFAREKRDSVRKVYRSQIAKIHDTTPKGLDSLMLEVESNPELYKKLIDSSHAKIETISKSL